MSPPVAALLSALLFSAGRGGEAGPVWDCDNGKLWLERDLPPSDMWSCPGPVWPESTQKLPGIDTRHRPQTAQQVCMDTPISYSHSIPNSGASRPLGGESGEYLFCPPQRWINNLQHGATALLYHPCAPVRQRVRLSVLARSCLTSYIITPHANLSTHRPFALVSWGRTLELAGVTASEVCDWLEETAAVAGGNHGDDAGSGKYSLLLARPAEPTRRHRDGAGTLRRCCRDTLLSALSQDGRMEERRRRRERRAAMGGEVEVEKSEGKVEERGNGTAGVLGSVTASWVSGTAPGATEPSRKAQNQGRTPGPAPPGPGAPVTGGAPGREALGERGSQRDGEKPAKKKEEEEEESADAVEVREREVDRKRARTKRPQAKQKKAESETRPPPLLRGRGGGGGGGGAGPDRESGAPPLGAAVLSERIPTARTDEAVWAAAALGFLLVLLALSVLHTRLYRHWRTTPSLYWRDPRQDYDSVADVIRMRLRMADQRRKRRKKRASLSRRDECSLLPSSSSEEEDH